MVKSNNIFSILIKIVSTVLMVSAVGLELWNIYAVQTNSEIPSVINPFFWITRFAILAHSVEAFVAACYAPSKNKMRVNYGVYTFFVGTVGLLELFDESV